VLNLPWIWGMDNLMKIFVDGHYSEFYMNSADEWKLVLK
jgi:hypothetical protein